jgi:hypothetical protein
MRNLSVKESLLMAVCPYAALPEKQGVEIECRKVLLVGPPKSSPAKTQPKKMHNSR